MKKVILLIGLAGVTGLVKAQQPRVDLKLSNGLNNYFKPHADSLSKKLWVLQKPDLAVKQLNKSILSEVFSSKMPVVKAQSDDRMLVVKTDEPGMKYTMLIKKIPVAVPSAAVQLSAP